ncbi:MAG: hypothetical protein R3D03_05670 [Geminicoccaceae bacterium]
MNFANPDMVGHTGILEAAIKAVETVDTRSRSRAGLYSGLGGRVFVTADHGNCEQMIDPADGQAAYRPHHQPGAVLPC